MKRVIRFGNEEFYIRCKYCDKEYNLIEAKRKVKKTEPIRCPNCNCIVAK